MVEDLQTIVLVRQCHLAVALRVGADEMVAYDRELIEQAAAAGLTVLSPGISSHH